MRDLQTIRPVQYLNILDDEGNAVVQPFYEHLLEAHGAEFDDDFDITAPYVAEQLFCDHSFAHEHGFFDPSQGGHYHLELGEDEQ